jgi:Putative metal-binding motif
MRARARTRMLLGLAGVLAATLVPAGAATAAVGSDSFGEAAPLLFSVPGSVADTQPYTTQGGAEPGTGGTVPCPAMFHTAWWVITGTGQQINLTTAGSTFNTTLAVYDPSGGDPLDGNRKACAEGGGGGVLAALTFPSFRGRRYLVQVGGALASNFGSIALSAASPVRPPNDDRAAAQVLTTGVPATVGNTGASQELGERLACATANYAATIWFRWTAPAVGDVAFSSSAAFGDTVVTVHRASDGAILGCNAGSTARVAVRVAPGDHLVQVGTKGSDVDGLGTGPITARADFVLDPDVDNDGELASTDCNDRNPGIRHGIVDAPDDGIDQNCDGADAVNLDRDGDGETRPGDCDDTNAAIRHGARDLPGNRIDEDCADGPAPFPRLESTVRTAWQLPFKLTKLQVLKAVAGSKVTLRCKGGGCPFKRKVVKVRKSSAALSVLSRKLKRARLERGAVLEVRITMPGHVGFMRRHTVRGARKDPKIEAFCLPVGKGKPTRC